MSAPLLIVKPSVVLQSLLKSMVEVQNSLRQLRKIDRENRARLRVLILAGAKVEPGEHFVEIQRSRTGHRMVVR